MNRTNCNRLASRTPHPGPLTSGEGQVEGQQMLSIARLIIPHLIAARMTPSSMATALRIAAATVFTL
jgi:hypothetical protein